MTAPACSRLMALRHLAPPAPALGWAVAVLFWLYYLAAFLAPAHRPWHMPLTVAAAGLAGIGALALRHRFVHPCVVLVGCCLFLGPASIGAAFVAQATSARRHGTSPIVLLSGGWLILAKIMQLLAGPYRTEWDGAATVESTIGIGGLVVATLIGWLSRSIAGEQAWRDDARAARRDADHARIERTRLRERERIAREMHDVLAHRLSLVAMHAGALAYVDDLDTPTARETARVIQRNARQALDELRVVLTRLRDGRAAPEPPQPTLRELPVLVAEVRESGTRVRLDLNATGLADLPSQVSRSAYRIVQECLTNARKHAPDAPVEVSIADGANEDLVLTVSNPVGGPAIPDPSGAGLGLIGITERAEMLGGTITSTMEHNQFALTVRIPRRAR
ncbi:sensor histidine kinase [Rhizomonospora bruguierae]|uniref:sensor histidine kinase n=1 Tax=Rhizomonospora bruguierae TaxID=1581705 RepID=UPI0020BE1392|nr:histidine kinase [Micromonospora sp. NBRC 107566]